MYNLQDALQAEIKRSAVAGITQEDLRLLRFRSTTEQASKQFVCRVLLQAIPTRKSRKVIN